MGLLKHVVNRRNGSTGIMSVLLFCAFVPAVIRADSNADQWRYRRNSIYSIMILHPEYKFGEELESMFQDLPMYERFNDHSLGVKTVKFATSDRKDQRRNIDEFIAKAKLGQRMVSKWFNRDKQTGAFDMELVKSRGLYDAGDSQVELAKSTARGLALLADAGEELIPNTYVMFNDVMYNSRSGAGSLLKMFGNAYIGNASAMVNSMQEIAGFKVTVKSYLYKLVWNEEVAYRFYNDFYYECDAVSMDKKKAYEDSAILFRLEFVGVSESSAQNTSFAGVKNPVEAMRKLCVRVIDQNLSDLQHSFPDFRLKAPLLSAHPLIADIGIKEGITENSRFEVLQPELQQNGRLSYRRIGTIRPISGKIKDNRYMAVEEEADNANLVGTEFERIDGGDFYPGMLVREY